MAGNIEKDKSNEAIEFLGNIQTSFRGMKTFMWICAIVCVIICIGFYVVSSNRIEAAARNIYVIDQGSVLEAARADNGEQRDLEVMDHMTRFLELFYNLSPNISLINQSIERALNMADESAYSYFNDLKEDKYYSRLIQINANQQISVDSIRVNMKQYPYQIEAKASLYVLRESNLSRYTFTATADAVDCERSKENPHGLMLKNYYATTPELKGTVKR